MWVTGPCAHTSWTQNSELGGRRRKSACCSRRPASPEPGDKRSGGARVVSGTRDPRCPHTFSSRNALRIGATSSPTARPRGWHRGSCLTLARFPSCPHPPHPRCLCLCHSEKLTLNITVNHEPLTVWVSLFPLIPTRRSRVSSGMRACVSALLSRSAYRSTLCMY